MKSNFLIFGGTVEGRQLTETLSKYCISLTVSVATEYGESLLSDLSNVRILTGRMDESEMIHLLETEAITHVIDATHPYALMVSDNILSACNKTGIPYLRVLRTLDNTKNDCIYVSSLKDCVNYLEQTEGNILVTTGSKELGTFTLLTDYQSRIYARVLPMISVLEECNNYGFQGKHLLCMQGPFTEDLNYALLKQYNIQYLVTKETGKAGGYEDKLNAAKRAGITTIVIGLPEQTTGLSYDEAFSYLIKEYNLEPLEETTVKTQQYNKDNYKRTIYLLSLGPGGIDYLTKGALDTLSSCDIIIGASRMVESLSFCNKPYYVSYKPEEILSYLSLHTHFHKIVICYSGDIGFYSGTKNLYPLLSDYNVKTIPGISSLVYLCSRLHMQWEDVIPISLHGQKANLIEAVEIHSKVFVLLDHKNTVSSVCQLLKDYHYTNVTVHVGERLSYEDEHIFSGSLDDLITQQYDSLSVLLIINESAKNSIITHGLRDTSFLRKEIPMTKSEIRSISLSKLELSNDSIVYDIGAGTGSVAIEVAKQCRNGYVYAVEKKAEGVSLIEDNKLKFQVSNLSVIQGVAPEILESLPSPTHAFIGGTSGNLKNILLLLLDKNPYIRIVINCIALETVSEALNCIKELSFMDIDIITATIAKSKEVGNYHMMMGQNPVTIISCRGGQDTTLTR
jgi:precorrin-6Y C5,15-methyltransferase (decarboxylating)